EIRSGELVINEVTYLAQMKRRSLDLTFKEFELLKFLAQQPGRVFTRAQLLQEVWGYDYFGGTRTVDVHVRRRRAKLGAENEDLIGTVRNVGYRFVPARASGRPADTDDATAQHAAGGEPHQADGDSGHPADQADAPRPPREPRPAAESQLADRVRPSDQASAGLRDGPRAVPRRHPDSHPDNGGLKQAE